MGSVLLLKKVNPLTPIWQFPNELHMGLTSGQKYYTGGVGTDTGEEVLYVVFVLQSPPKPPLVQFVMVQFDTAQATAKSQA